MFRLAEHPFVRLPLRDVAIGNGTQARQDALNWALVSLCTGVGQSLRSNAI